MPFEIKTRDIAGRLGKFSTSNIIIETPNLLPVINPNKMIISPKTMRSLFGTDAIITNSYIIYKDKNLSKDILKQGLHKYLDFSGLIMTDSGTFQSYVYGSVDIDPLKIFQFQRDIGTDIGTILDVFTTPNQSYEQAQQAVAITLDRLKACVEEKKQMLLASTIQGSVYPKLRKYCAQQMSKLAVDVVPIGGVVPLMETQRYSDLVRIIIASKQGLDPSKPVHLFGAGHPLLYPLAVALGCDLFDSSSYIKYAQDGRMLFPWGTEHFELLDELPCSCPICTKYNIKEIKKSEKRVQIELLAKHNLYLCYAELRRIKNAIKRGTLWHLIEEHASHNPHIYDAFHVLKKPGYNKWLEKNDTITKKRGVIYASPHTFYQPLITRIYDRLLTRYIPSSKKATLLPRSLTEYPSSYTDKILLILHKNPKITLLKQSQFGPIPLELDEMYPFAQSEFPENIDLETQRCINKFKKKFLKKFSLIDWEKIDDTKKGFDHDNFIQMWDERRVKCIINMQFGKSLDKVFLSHPLRIEKSKNTGKIRRIYSQNKHILSMRAQDGLFTLKIHGGAKIHRKTTAPFMRIQITTDAVPFVLNGKSVFSKFVIKSDPNLRPFDECIIVDKNDTFIGIGRCILTANEMRKFRYGVAAKNRSTVKKVSTNVNIG